MKDTDQDPEREGKIAGRPAWVDAQDEAVRVPPRRDRPVRRPVPGHQDEDGLWEHALVTGGIVVLVTWLAAILIPRQVPLWEIVTAAGAVAMVTWYTSLTLTQSLAMSGYLAAWGAYLTGWLAAARLAGPWHGIVIFALLLPAAILIPAGVAVIRRHRDRVNRIIGTGRDNANIRECLHWEDLLPRLGVLGADVRDVIRTDVGYQVHGRLGKITGDGRQVSGMEAVRQLPAQIIQHKRLTKGSVYIEEEPAGGSGADFIIHVQSAAGPRLIRFLPAENKLLSVNRAFALGVFDTGREFTLLLREIRVFICGLIGSGKSTLLNVFIAQLARMPDALICVIDLKGGQESMAWMMPWLLGLVDQPVIHWLATTRQEADIMLDALKRAGKARAESGRYKRKLRPRPDAPAFIVLCDETTAMTGHNTSEDGLSSTKLATKLLHISEMYRSVAIDPVVSSVRAGVDNMGNSGIKALSDARIGMKASTMDEGRQIFPDDIPAARQLAQLKDKGMGIPKIRGQLSPPVHFYNITDGTDDDDGHPTEDRITPIAIACSARRPQPEQFVIDAMGEAYANRWDQPHLKELMAGWLAEAGNAQLPGPSPEEPEASGDDLPDDFRQWKQELENDGGELDDREGRPLNPARKRMRELLIERGRPGYKPDTLWHLLQAEGHTVARETVQRWLRADEQLGYVYRPRRSYWVWRLAPGAEFDIPGMG